VLSRHHLAIWAFALGLAAAPTFARAASHPPGDAPDVVSRGAQSVAKPEAGAPALAAAADSAAVTSISGEDPVRAALWRAWATPLDLHERVLRVQRAGLSAGIGDLDGPAWALLLDPAFGTKLQRAELAVELAPELPAAHAALASAQLDQGQIGAAAAALREALEMAREIAPEGDMVHELQRRRAEAFTARGDFALALKAAEDALQRSRRLRSDHQLQHGSGLRDPQATDRIRSVSF